MNSFNNDRILSLAFESRALITAFYISTYGIPMDIITDILQNLFFYSLISKTQAFLSILFYVRYMYLQYIIAYPQEIYYCLLKIKKAKLFISFAFF